MATVCVTVPDDQAVRIIAAIAEKTGETYATMDDGIDIVQRYVFRDLSTVTIGFEAQAAAHAVSTNQDDPLVSAIVTQGG